MLESIRFRETAEKLFKFADLGAPQFAPNGSLSLSFDEVDLTLKTTEDDESLLVRAYAGQIASAGADMAKQTETVLKLGFALLASHDVLVTLENSDVIVSGTYPYDVQNINQLASVLSDVVSATETVSRVTVGATIAPPQTRPREDQTNEEVMIFQP